MLDSIRWYQKHAREAAERYESVAAEDLHGWLHKFLPEESGRILDLGAGSGRDAAWLAGLGHQVVAVEPSSAMRKEAVRRHSEVGVQWRGGSLPTLSKLSRQEPFDLILVSGVWQHVAKSDRKRAFRKMLNLLKPDGVLAMTLRHGPEIPGRKTHAVSVEELESLARDHGAFVAYRDEDEDGLGRKEVRWTRLAIRFPDDGTDALPVLRHVILVQSKSATHKLGLLRTLCRIADGAPGIARAVGDGTVSLPMGLVALTWLRLYMPLLDEDLPQTPLSTPERLNLGFVKDAYWKIKENLSPLDLRVGKCFKDESGVAIDRALRDAAANIKNMPIQYLTYPGQDKEPILQVEKSARRRVSQEVRLDEEYLFSFGEVRIKESLWQALRKHSVWVEPVVISEWSEMIRGYMEGQNKLIDENSLRLAMAWSDPERDVRVAQKQALRLMQDGQLQCVWSGQPLRRKSLDIDHCLPWSIWACEDLWNLMPAHSTVNRNSKRDRLPSEQVMDKARDRIVKWWDQAYLQVECLGDRFLAEAASSLPGDRHDFRDLKEIFESLCAQRENLRRNQKPPEWGGVGARN